MDVNTLTKSFSRCEISPKSKKSAFNVEKSFQIQIFIGSCSVVGVKTSVPQLGNHPRQ